MKRSIAMLIAAQIILFGALAAYVAATRSSELASYSPVEPPMSRLAGLAP